MRIDASQLAGLEQRLRKRSSDAGLDLAEAIRAQASTIVSALRASTPRETGRLRASWQAQRTPSGAIFENAMPYAGYDGRDERARQTVRDTLNLQTLAKEVHNG